MQALIKLHNLLQTESKLDVDLTAESTAEFRAKIWYQ